MIWEGVGLTKRWRKATVGMYRVELAAAGQARALYPSGSRLTQILELQVFQAEVVEKVSPLLHFEEGRAGQGEVELLAGSQHVCNVQWVLCAPRRGASGASGEGGRGREEATGGGHRGR